MSWTAKELKIKNGLSGISQRQLDEHYTLYKGYVGKLNEIQEKITQANLVEANPTFSWIRELKREEAFTTNAIRLHESYFENLTSEGGKPSGQIADLIQQDFGSYDNWENHIKAYGMTARGWVILAFDYSDGKLHNYCSDIHSDGVWNCTPLLVLDVYEHAYFLDYATARKTYLDAYFTNVNWQNLNTQLDKLNIMQIRMAA